MTRWCGNISCIITLKTGQMEERSRKCQKETFVPSLSHAFFPLHHLLSDSSSLKSSLGSCKHKKRIHLETCQTTQFFSILKIKRKKLLLFFSQLAPLFYSFSYLQYWSYEFCHSFLLMSSLLLNHCNKINLLFFNLNYL